MGGNAEWLMIRVRVGWRLITFFLGRNSPSYVIRLTTALPYAAITTRVRARLRWDCRHSFKVWWLKWPNFGLHRRNCRNKRTHRAATAVSLNRRAHFAARCDRVVSDLGEEHRRADGSPQNRVSGAKLSMAARNTARLLVPHCFLCTICRVRHRTARHPAQRQEGVVLAGCRAPSKTRQPSRHEG